METEINYKSRKGQVQTNTNTCVLCGTCQYVCPSGAIDIQESKDKKGFDFRIWHNTCTLCGNCEYFCPTKSIHLSNQLNKINLQKDKYKNVTVEQVSYVECIECGDKMIKVADELLLKGFGHINNEIKKLAVVCHACRQKRTFLKRVKYK